MRVLLVSKSTGGLGTYMRWLARGLNKEQFELTFVCLSDGGPELADELARLYGVNTLSWPMNRYKINPLTDLKVIIRLAGLLRKERFDLVHANGSKAGFIARIAATGSGIPVIYSPHGFAFDTRIPGWLAYFYARIEDLSARLFTARIMTVSDAEQKAARRYHVGQPAQFTTVHSGIETAPFNINIDIAAKKRSLNIPADAPVIGTVGRLIAQKAPLDFVELAALLHKNHPSVHFIWAGDGELENACRERCNQLGLQDVFHFLGMRTDIPELLKIMECFVLTSHWEAFPIALLEAMAAELPVISTALDGVQEVVVEGQTGYLAPIGDLNCMQTAIAKILNEPTLKLQLGQNGRQRIEQHFTRAMMLENIANLYKNTRLS